MFMSYLLSKQMIYHTIVYFSQQRLVLLLLMKNARNNATGIIKHSNLRSRLKSDNGSTFSLEEI